MNKNLLFISTDKQSQNLTTLLDALSDKGYKIFVLTNDQGIKQKINEKNWQIIKMPGWLRMNGFFNSYLFVVLWPVMLVMNSILVMFLRYKYDINKFILLGMWEKTCFSPLASLLGFGPVWLECPGVRYRDLNYFIKLALRIGARYARIIVFNDFTKNELKKIKIQRPSYDQIEPAVNVVDYRIQENIFTKIAENDQRSKQHKFFTVGTVAKLNEKQKIEILFQAVKKCLSVIPELQIIIIGEGEEKKNLLWLAKKMGIENMVWFVGEQNMLKKWFENMDVFVDTSVEIDLAKIAIILRSMAAGLPVICQKGRGLDEIIEDYISGLLLDSDDSETLAQRIIQLNQNRDLRRRIARQSQEIAVERFSVAKQAETFITIINK